MSLPPATDNVQLVSLGSTSAAKVCFKKLGRASGPLPFDWVLTTLDGLLNFLTNEFQGFYSFAAQDSMQVPGSNKSVPVLRSSMHVVRKDDPTVGANSNYDSQIAALKAMSAEEQPIVFVRVATTSEEIQCAGTLAQALVQKFGPKCYLYMIVDDQSKAYGPTAVQNLWNVMIDYVNTEKSGAPYMESVKTALLWASGTTIPARQVPHLQHASDMAEPTEWGIFTASGEEVFHEINSGFASVQMALSVQEQMGILPPAVQFVPELGSEKLEKSVFINAVERDSQRDRIQLVSLGHASDVKVSFRQIGRGKEAFPFDWVRTTMEGVMHFLEHDFQGFFDYDAAFQMTQTDGSILKVFRSHKHSFWHDDPYSPVMQNAYQHRITNLKALEAQSQQILFVREAACTSDVRKANRLAQILYRKYGHGAALLLLVDNQGADNFGACVVNTEPNIMVYFCDTNSADEKRYAPMIEFALDWMASRPTAAQTAKDMEHLMQHISQDHSNGLKYCGQQCFEGCDGNQDNFKFAVEIKEGQVLDSDIMEQIPTKKVAADAATDGIQLVSLGCSCAPKLSFKGIGRGAETLPFDWVRTTMKGVYQLMTSNFKDFYDFTTRQVVDVDGGGTMTMFRSEEHSFWHDDPTIADTREKYNRRIARFNTIDAREKGVLFVRGAATTDEVADAGIIVTELVRRFGKYACFLLVIDFQGIDAKGAVVVESEPNLMVYFNDTESVGAQTPHSEAIKKALDWCVGRPISALTVPDLDAAELLVTKRDHYGLRGTGGVRAFESVLQDPRLADHPSDHLLGATTNGKAPVPQCVQQATNGNTNGHAKSKAKTAPKQEPRAAKVVQATRPGSKQPAVQAKTEGGEGGRLRVKPIQLQAREAARPEEAAASNRNSTTPRQAPQVQSTPMRKAPQVQSTPMRAAPQIQTVPRRPAPQVQSPPLRKAPQVQSISFQREGAPQVQSPPIRRAPQVASISFPREGDGITPGTSMLVGRGRSPYHPRTASFDGPPSQRPNQIAVQVDAIGAQGSLGTAAADHLQQGIAATQSLVSEIDRLSTTIKGLAGGQQQPLPTLYASVPARRPADMADRPMGPLPTSYGPIGGRVPSVGPVIERPSSFAGPPPAPGVAMQPLPTKYGTVPGRGDLSTKYGPVPVAVEAGPARVLPNAPVPTGQIDRLANTQRRLPEARPLGPLPTMYGPVPGAPGSMVARAPGPGSVLPTSYGFVPQRATPTENPSSSLRGPGPAFNPRSRSVGPPPQQPPPINVAGPSFGHQARSWVPPSAEMAPPPMQPMQQMPQMPQPMPSAPMVMPQGMHSMMQSPMMQPQQPQQPQPMGFGPPPMAGPMPGAPAFGGGPFPFSAEPGPARPPPSHQQSHHQPTHQPSHHQPSGGGGGGNDEDGNCSLQ